MYGRKHCEKRRNCLLQAISPFLTMFSSSLERQNAVLCGNGLTLELVKDSHAQVHCHQKEILIHLKQSLKHQTTSVNNTEQH